MGKDEQSELVSTEFLLGFSFSRALICCSTGHLRGGNWCRDIRAALQELDRMQRADPLLMHMDLVPLVLAA